MLTAKNTVREDLTQTKACYKAGHPLFGPLNWWEVKLN